MLDKHASTARLTCCAVCTAVAEIAAAARAAVGSQALAVAAIFGCAVVHSCKSRENRSTIEQASIAHLTCSCVHNAQWCCGQAIQSNLKHSEQSRPVAGPIANEFDAGATIHAGIRSTVVDLGLTQRPLVATRAHAFAVATAAVIARAVCAGGTSCATRALQKESRKSDTTDQSVRDC